MVPALAAAPSVKAWLAIFSLPVVVIAGEVLDDVTSAADEIGSKGAIVVTLVLAVRIMRSTYTDATATHREFRAATETRLQIERDEWETERAAHRADIDRLTASHRADIDRLTSRIAHLENLLDVIMTNPNQKGNREND